MDLLFKNAANCLFNLSQLYCQMSRPSQGGIMILTFLLAFQIPTWMANQNHPQQQQFLGDSVQDENETYLPKIPFLKFYPTEMADGWGNQEPKAVCTTTSNLRGRSYFCCPKESEPYEITCTNKGLDENQAVLWKCKMDIVPVQDYFLDKATVICLRSQVGQGHVLKNSCKIVFSTHPLDGSRTLNIGIGILAFAVFFLHTVQKRLPQYEPIEPIMETPSATSATNKDKPKKDFKFECCLFECLLSGLVILRIIVFLQQEDLTKTYILNK